MEPKRGIRVSDKDWIDIKFSALVLNVTIGDYLVGLHRKPIEMLKTDKVPKKISSVPPYKGTDKVELETELTPRERYLEWKKGVSHG